MSQRPNEPDHQRRKTSVSHGKRPELSTQNFPTDGGVYWPNEIQMNGSNASGEQLEGSTLGSSSRDGDRGSRDHHRAQNSGGFLLDSTSSPRTRPLHAGVHHRRPHDSNSRVDPPVSGKRSATDPASVLPKKKSRFPWSRQRNGTTTAGSSRPLAASSSAGSSADAGYRERALTPSTPSDTQEQGRSAGTTSNRDGDALGLDFDSAHIVNLALNLNESRKNGAPGRSNLGQISGGIAGVPAQPASAGNFAQHPFQTHNSLPQTSIGDRLRARDTPTARRQASTFNQLPGADERDYPFVQYSDTTLQRVEKTRLHFELFYQYLRLLRLLPPLRHPVTDDTSDNADISAYSKHGSRIYNPLQSIRNRKVRFREKSAIDPGSDGWNDIERVREWVDMVEGQHDQQGHNSDECLRLPRLRKGNQRDVLAETPEDVGLFQISPPSSLRRVSHASSGLKRRIPRLDWMISPAELLADAAWVEEEYNKSKIVDKDGNPLYPDLAELISADDNIDISNLSEPGGRPSIASGRSLSFGFRGAERGRPRFRSRSSSQFSVRSSSMSGRGRELPKGRRTRARSSSSSYVSPHNVDEFNRGPWHHRARLTDRETSGNAQVPRLKEFGGGIVNQPKYGPAQESGPPGLYSKIHRHRAKTDQKAESISSIPSMEGRYNSRMPEDTIDDSGVGSPSRVGCFPSITVDLSPPSSRSPSPAKRHLPRVIGTIRDRSGSKHRKRISREDLDNEPLATGNISKRSTQRNLESPESASWYDASRALDNSSWSFGESQRTNDSTLTDTPRTQKGPFHPESKLRRGIYKGRGRIAEIVGNEVSKVGDFLKKDTATHNRKTSNPPSISSTDSGLDDGEATKPDLKSSLLRRLATSSDDSSPLSGPNLDKQIQKSFIPNLPNFTSSSKRVSQAERREASDADILNEQSKPPNVDLEKRAQRKGTDASAGPQIKFDIPRPSDKSAEGQRNRSTVQKPRGENVKGAFIPARPPVTTRPPVTGLAKAEASTEPSSGKRRRGLADSSRSWSISDRSISMSVNLGLPEKTEIERTRALLLCSGIKAREITRRAQTVRSPPPDFLIKSVVDPTAIPRLTRVDEHEYAVRNLVQRFEKSNISLQQSMDRFSTTICPPLKSQLKDLDNLIDRSLSGRVRVASTEADNLNVQLSTTATLAVKQLSDILDRAARRRHRRFRWLRGASFWLLEWTLVTVMWWVWLFVMVFKVIRGIFRGAVTGVRWVLWL